MDGEIGTGIAQVAVLIGLRVARCIPQRVFSCSRRNPPSVRTGQLSAIMSRSRVRALNVSVARVMHTQSAK